ncbi:MAG: epoxyqueuosine reductase [Deltaproteobacteria bacterium]|nr:epoxyqueuosine reductase [Deltaproteobacteria bacterium]MBW2139109.1 epoxyqueuosine reductase [Deltaproteobacteria bacterium]
MSSSKISNNEILARAESFPGMCAGIARLEDVLKGPSYGAFLKDKWSSSLLEEPPLGAWPEGAKTALVLGLNHPEGEPELDWWYKGNSDGNRRLIEAAESMKRWLKESCNVDAFPLPYHVEKGGLFLKDAAVMAGVGIIGQNNLLLHKEWGPQIRLRAILLQGHLDPGPRKEDFSPCENCHRPCRNACPQGAFESGTYDRSRCFKQIEYDVRNKMEAQVTMGTERPELVVKYCRACELACPLGGR